MPITPRFHLSQTPTTITLTVHLPHIRLSSIELIIEQSQISLSIRPYLLKLSLPGFIEIETYKTNYNPNIENGTLYIELIKLNSGEYFENLNMITSLFNNTTSTKKKSSTTLQSPITIIDDGEEFENGYGFARGYSQLFGCIDIETTSNFLEEYPHLLELHAENILLKQRNEQRQNDENSIFSIERFRQDTFNDEVLEDFIYVEAISFVTPYAPHTFSFQQQEKTNTDIVKDLASVLHIITTTTTTKNMDNSIFSFGKTNNSSSPSLTTNLLSTDEQHQLSRLRNKSFTWIKNIQQALFSILDVLLAYSHELRMTNGEFNVESPLTIRKLSATLSYSIYFDNIQQVYQAFTRRALCFSYIRRWDLICHAAIDTRMMFETGNKLHVIRSLLMIKSLFSKSDTLYLLNRLFIDDMLIWIQNLKEHVYIEFVKDIISTSREIFVLGTISPSSIFVGWKLLGSSNVQANLANKANRQIVMMGMMCLKVLSELT